MVFFHRIFCLPLTKLPLLNLFATPELQVWHSGHPKGPHSICQSGTLDRRERHFGHAEAALWHTTDKPLHGIGIHGPLIHTNINKR